MQFSIALPTDRVDRVEEFVTGAAVAELAAGFESAGFDACFVTDHPAPDARWLAAGGHHALEPVVALAFAAAATTRLRLQTHIMVLAYRNPFLAAKQVLSLDALSGGRVILGVASGYLKPEFAALGVDFDERNDLTDEAIDVMRRAWTQDDVVAEGRHFRARGVTMRPRPVARPHPPIWVGGNSRAAIRRAVERAEGWVPFPNPAAAGRAVRTPTLETLADLRARTDYLREHAAAVGRTEPIDVCFAPFSIDWSEAEGTPYEPDAVLDELEALADLGVTAVVVGPRGDTRREYLARATAFADAVIAPWRARHPDR